MKIFKSFSYGVIDPLYPLVFITLSASVILRFVTKQSMVESVSLLFLYISLYFITGCRQRTRILLSFHYLRNKSFPRLPILLSYSLLSFPLLFIILKSASFGSGNAAVLAAGKGSLFWALSFIKDPMVILLIVGVRSVNLLPLLFISFLFTFASPSSSGLVGNLQSILIVCYFKYSFLRDINLFDLVRSFLESLSRLKLKILHSFIFISVFILPCLAFFVYSIIHNRGGLLDFFQRIFFFAQFYDLASEYDAIAFAGDNSLFRILLHPFSVFFGVRGYDILPGLFITGKGFDGPLTSVPLLLHIFSRGNLFIFYIYLLIAVVVAAVLRIYLPLFLSQICALFGLRSTATECFLFVIVDIGIFASLVNWSYSSFYIFSTILGVPLCFFLFRTKQRLDGDYVSLKST